jgi:type II secretory pathway component PulM
VPQITYHDAAAPMARFWKFIGSKGNRERLAWLGGGAVIVVAGIWSAFVHFFPTEGSTHGRETKSDGISTQSSVIKGNNNNNVQVLTVTPPITTNAKDINSKSDGNERELDENGNLITKYHIH